MPVEVICDFLGNRYGRDPWEYEDEDYDRLQKYWKVNQIRIEEENKHNNKSK